MSDLEKKIEANLQQHIKASLIDAVLSKAGTATLAELSKLTEHAKYGEVASEMKIQEFLDAYVKVNGYEQPSDVAVEAPKVASADGGEKSGASPSPSKDGQEGKKLNLKNKDQRVVAFNVVRDIVKNARGGAVAASTVVKECISKDIHCNQGQVRKILKSLIDEKLVLATGYARSTGYHWAETASEETKAQAAKDLVAASEGTSKVK